MKIVSIRNFAGLLVVGTFVLFTAVVHAGINDGLVAYYPFNGNANDMSGSGYNGTVNGATLTTDRFGNPNSAYSFNGTGAYISTTFYGILGSNPRTISFWAKTSSPNYMDPLSYGLNSTTYGSTFRCELNFPVNGSTCPSNSANPGVSIDISGSEILYNATVSDNVWHNYVYVVPSIANPKTSDVLVYMDEVLLTSITGYCMTTSRAINTQLGTPVTIGKVFRL